MELKFLKHGFQQSRSTAASQLHCTMQTYKGTPSKSQTDEDRNTIAANKGATNSDMQQLTSSPDED